MSTICPRCQSPIETNSRFCTNCGAVLSSPEPNAQPNQPYQVNQPDAYSQPGQSGQSGQSGQYGQYSQQSQVPPWASANPSGASYQQQQWNNPANPSTGGSLGFGGRNDALAKKILTYVVAGIVITLALLLLLGLLAVFVAPLRWLFCIFLFVVILVPLIIYSTIRNYIRRTVGRLWWFF
jgi:hypothetical protein